MNTEDHLISGSTHFFRGQRRARQCRQWSAESKAIYADPVIISGSYDRCKRSNQLISSSFHFKCIIYYSAVLYMHIVLNNQWVEWMSCCLPPRNETVRFLSASVKSLLAPSSGVTSLFPPDWAECASRPCTSVIVSVLRFLFLSPLVISISGMCLMVWDSLVNRSRDKQPISAPGR